MMNLIINEFKKVRIIKIIITYILVITSLILINKYSNKSIFDMSFNIIPFIGIFVSLLFSGSVCFEIENGTMKYYLTKPYKRYKVYLSKLITILLYIFMSYLIIIITTSLIGDSFNYKYSLKYLVHMIPIIFLSSYVLFLSTSFKSHVFVSSMSILTLCFSLTISQVLFGLGFNIIEYTFLPYLDYSIFNDKLLILNMNNELNTNINLKMGIVLDILYFFLLLFLGMLKFQKKDIKY